MTGPWTAAEAGRYAEQKDATPDLMSGIFNTVIKW